MDRMTRTVLRDDQEDERKDGNQVAFVEFRKNWTEMVIRVQEKKNRGNKYRPTPTDMPEVNEQKGAKTR